MNLNVIESGDILIYSCKDLISKMIKFFAFDTYSHVNIAIWLRSVDPLIITENNNDGESTLYVFDTNMNEYIKHKYSLYKFSIDLEYCNVISIRKINKFVKTKINLNDFLFNFINQNNYKIRYNYNYKHILSRMFRRRIECQKGEYLCVDMVNVYLTQLYHKVYDHNLNSKHALVPSSFISSTTNFEWNKILEKDDADNLYKNTAFKTDGIFILSIVIILFILFDFYLINSL